MINLQMQIVSNVIHNTYCKFNAVNYYFLYVTIFVIRCLCVKVKIEFCARFIEIDYSCKLAGTVTTEEKHRLLFNKKYYSIIILLDYILLDLILINPSCNLHVF